MFDYPSAWETLAGEVLPRAKLIILVGAVDTGKSTMTAYLASAAFRFGYRTAVVDADVGQSEVGPPGTVGMGLLRQPVTHLQEVPLAAFYFVGATTPRGHVVAAVVGTKRMVEEAFALGAERVIVNTTGLVGGNLGRTLKYQKVALLQPEAIIGLARGSEIEPLLKTWEAMGFPVYRLGVAPGVRRRSFEMRAAFREKRWREFFTGSRRLTLPFGSFRTVRTTFLAGEPLAPPVKEAVEAITGERVVWAERALGTALLVTRGRVSGEKLALVAEYLGVARCLRLPPESFQGVVVSLLGPDGRALSLGWVEEIDYRGGNLTLFTPYRGEVRVTVVEFGDIRLDRGIVLGEKGMKSATESA